MLFHFQIEHLFKVPAKNDEWLCNSKVIMNHADYDHDIIVDLIRTFTTCNPLESK